METKKNSLYLGGVSAQQLISEFQSPLYVYEEQTIRRRVSELQNSIAFEDKEIKYSCKANTNIEIMKILREMGTGVDAVSPGEVFAALRAGYSKSSILFTANNTSWEDIEYAVSSGIMVNIDSLSQLETFGKKYPNTEVCIRINPDVGAGHHNHVITGGPESKFGIYYTEIQAVREIVRRHGLQVRGIHQHIGSGILDPDMFVKAMDVLIDAAGEFSELRFIDFGGGIGVPYRKDEEKIDVRLLGSKITERFRRFCDEYGKPLKLVIEPGRYLVAESGFLLATVTAVKESERHCFVGIDTGFNHLVRPAMYGSYHEILHASNGAGEQKLQAIAGNLCESADTFTRNENGIVDRMLPVFQEGDIVCICDAGAYGYSMASIYNSRPRPAEVMVKDGKARPIRRRETLDDLFKSTVETESSS